VRFGECAHTAADVVSGIRDEEARVNVDQHHQGDGALLLVHRRVLALCARKAGWRVYGSGLLSSFSEVEHALVSPAVPAPSDPARVGD